MKVIEARNVHQALPQAVAMLQVHGINRNSRNGGVRMMREPVTTHYTHPMERVVFWHDRDANPFFHLYEGLWMLAGRSDIAPLCRYVPGMANFSDDGDTMHGAYGARWRNHFVSHLGLFQDQLTVIADRLRKDKNDRRCILQMWDAPNDLDNPSKDVPCNTTITFQRDGAGYLDMTVFNRSNDIVWGCYGANAVHFAFLLEYMATAIGCDPGWYEQVSVNWHAYDKTFKQVEGIPSLAFDESFGQHRRIRCPYDGGRVNWVAMFTDLSVTQPIMDHMIEAFLVDADTDFELPPAQVAVYTEPFFNMARQVLRAHALYRKCTGIARYDEALKCLKATAPRVDWVVAASEWIMRRRETFLAKQQTEAEGEEA